MLTESDSDSMSYIAHLQSLGVEQQTSELHGLILKHQKTILKDKSRLHLLSEDQYFTFDTIEKLTIGKITIDALGKQCIVMLQWKSDGPHDVDYERQMLGEATACIADNGAVSFSDLKAWFDGEAPHPRPIFKPLSEEEEERIQDEQDYTENITKDW